MSAKIYCGNNLYDSKLLNNTHRLGTLHECFRIGFNKGYHDISTSLYEPNYKAIDDRKIYCGNSNVLPASYDYLGNTVLCLQKGFGLGKSKKSREEYKSSSSNSSSNSSSRSSNSSSRSSGSSSSSSNSSSRSYSDSSSSRSSNSFSSSSSDSYSRSERFTSPLRFIVYDSKDDDETKTEPTFFNKNKIKKCKKCKNSLRQCICATVSKSSKKSSKKKSTKNNKKKKKSIKKYKSSYKNKRK